LEFSSALFDASYRLQRIAFPWGENKSESLVRQALPANPLAADNKNPGMFWHMPGEVGETGV